VWSIGSPVDSCGNGTLTYIDGGPVGAFCCATEAGSGTADVGTEPGDAGADAGAGAAIDGAPAAAATDGGPADAGGG
jgi:hypothetical protein